MAQGLVDRCHAFEKRRSERRAAKERKRAKRDGNDPPNPTAPPTASRENRNLAKEITMDKFALVYLRAAFPNDSTVTRGPAVFLGLSLVYGILRFVVDVEEGRPDCKEQQSRWSGEINARLHAITETIDCICDTSEIAEFNATVEILRAIYDCVGRLIGEGFFKVDFKGAKMGDRPNN